MAEIIIAKINPTVPTGSSERIISATTVALLPDKSGSYQLDNGTPIILDLSQVKYYPPRVVETTKKGWVGDVYGYSSYEDVPIQRRISRRSWDVSVVSKALSGKSYRETSTGVNGWRTVPINRKGVGTQMLPEARELIIVLKQPVISYHRADGKWMQTHYYPDYPEMSGTIDSRGNHI